MNEDEQDVQDEEEFIDYSELPRHEVLNFSKDKSDRWEKVPDFFSNESDDFEEDEK